MRKNRRETSRKKAKVPDNQGENLSAAREGEVYVGGQGARWIDRGLGIF